MNRPSLAAVRRTRRDFLQSHGLCRRDWRSPSASNGWAQPAARWPLAPTPAVFAPNAFLRIGPDGSVTVIAKHLEMGQGAYTGIATVLAEELDADWVNVRVESAPADAKRYGNLVFGHARNRRQFCDGQFLVAAARGRRQGAGDAAHGSGEGMEGAQ